MNGYEEILNLMRREGNKGSTAPIQIGIMESPTECHIGELRLYEGDLLIAEHLKTGYLKDTTTFIGGLQKGDKVAIYRVSDEIYIVLERLV